MPRCISLTLAVLLLSVGGAAGAPIGAAGQAPSAALTHAGAGVPCRGTPAAGQGNFHSARRDM